MVRLCNHIKKLHEISIYHSDIKPANILLFLNFSYYNLVLGDFGSATENEEINFYTE